MPSPLEDFLAPYTPEVRQLAVHARRLILAVMPAAVEQLDPSARLIAFGLDRSYKGLVCGITLQKADINLMFARGAALPDPLGLLTGTGKKARHVKILRLEDLDQPGLRSLLEAALALAEG